MTTTAPIGYRVVVCLLALGSTLVSAQFGTGEDNKIVVGDPQVDCLSDMVSFKFQTKDAYTGHVYVQGHHDSSDCHKDYDLNRDNSGYMDVDFHKCGMRRQRTTNPKGMSMQATLVVQFHRTFVTYKDRAYNIECFYLEEEQVVSNNMTVSDLPTDALDVVPPMPQCQYRVLAGDADGAPIAYARVGERVYHKWTCDYPMPEMYCMIIHTCTVDDGESATYEVIDKNGCSKDDIILDHVHYTTDLMAGTQSQVFKFADRAHVFFTCQVRLSLKNEHPSGICPRPDCRTHSPLTRRLRLRRDASSASSSRLGEDFDLIARPVLVLDLDEPSMARAAANSRLDASAQSPRHWDALGGLSGRPSGGLPRGGVCLSQTSLGLLIAAAIISCATAFTLGGVYCLKTRALHKL